MGWRDNRDDDDDIDIGRGRRDATAPTKPGSAGWAIASFLISILNGLFLFVLILVATVITANQNAPMNDHDPKAIMLGLGILGGLALAVLGVILGFVGVGQKAGTVFAILGIIFNGLVLLSVLGLLVVGLAVGG